MLLMKFVLVLVIGLRSFVLATPTEVRRKRSVSLASMVNCGAKGDRKFLISFGQYCGIGGSGIPQNDIDRCCNLHDKCYERWVRACWLPTTKYITRYQWYCDHGRPRCGRDPYYYGHRDADDLCRSQICQCDAVFVTCLNGV